MSQPNPGCDNDRTRHSSHPTNLALSADGLETECLQDVGTEDRAVSTRIHQQRRLSPRTITRLNLRVYHGAHDAIIAHMPCATDAGDTKEPADHTLPASGREHRRSERRVC